MQADRECAEVIATLSVMVDRLVMRDYNHDLIKY